MATFNFLKSTQMCKLPFFLGTTTMGKNQVVSSTEIMNFVVNSLSKSCLTTPIDHDWDSSDTSFDGKVVLLYPLQFGVPLKSL